MDLSEIPQRLATMPELEKASGLLNLAGSGSRQKILFFLEQEKSLHVDALADRLELSVPAVCQRLAKLPSYRLVARRREAQEVHYRLTDHPFNETLRANFL
jgi:predicted ArsR family transcriptional regulator